jgi:hypothetical protein
MNEPLTRGGVSATPRSAARHATIVAFFGPLHRTLPPAEFDFVLGMNRRVFRVTADRIGPDSAPGLS